MSPEEERQQNILSLKKSVSAKEAEQKALAVLDMLNLADKAKSYPSTLSGGQKQRAAVRRGAVRQHRLRRRKRLVCLRRVWKRRKIKSAHGLFPLFQSAITHNI